MNKEEMSIIRKVVGSVTAELEEKTYLRKDVKLILLEVIKRLEEVND